MTVYLLIIIALGIIGLIGKLIKKENFRLKNESAFHSLYLFGYIAFFLFIINESSLKSLNTIFSATYYPNPKGRSR